MKKGQIRIQYNAQKVGFMDGKRLVGKAQRYTTIGYNEIVAYAAKAAAVPESSIEMSMDALFDAMNYFVLNGHSVQIPNLGTFSLGIRSKSTASEAEFTANFSQNLKNINIRFLPDSELKAMIATTSLLTDVEEVASYEGEGVLAVKSMFFAQGSQLLPVNAGLPVAIAPLSRIIFNGSRLTKDYLQANPLRLVVIKNDGTLETILPTKQISFAYTSLTCNLTDLLKYYPEGEIVAIKSFQLKDAEGNIVVEREFADVPASAGISAVSVNNTPVPVNATVNIPIGEEARVKVLGFGLGSAVIKMGGQAITPDSVSENMVNFKFTPQASGNYPITLEVSDTVVATYNLSLGQAGSASVSSVTANGDAMQNGASTNITAGSNYNIQIAGQGLGELTEDNFVLPENATLTIQSQSDTLITAVLGNAQAGDFKVVVDENIIFSAALVVVTPTVSVTGFKLSADGQTQSLTTHVTAEQNGSFSLILVGSNIDELSNSSFSGSGLSAFNYNAETGALSGSGHGTLVITASDTTIASITIDAYTANSGEDDTNGQLP